MAGTIQPEPVSVTDYKSTCCLPAAWVLVLSHVANMSVAMGSVYPQSHAESNTNIDFLCFVIWLGLIVSILISIVRYCYNRQDGRKWTEYFGLLAMVSFQWLRLLILLI